VEASLPEVLLRARIAVSSFWKKIPGCSLFQDLKGL
jgi:hypothetical protein